MAKQKSRRLRAAAGAIAAASAIPSLSALPWDLSSPERRIELPAELHEVSGICALDGSRIACVQDEEATIFVWDLSEERIISRHPFGEKGDWEGLAISGPVAWILRSDGYLARLSGWDGPEPRFEGFKTGLPAADNEGLCFDKALNRIILAPKSPLKGSGPSKKDRSLWFFDIPPAREDPPYEEAKPFLAFNLAQATALLPPEDRPRPKEGKKAGKKAPPISFRSSAVALDPLSGGYLILSAIDPYLALMDQKGNLASIFRLDPEIFNQPEGMTVLPDGRLVVSNEGGTGRASLLIFRPRADPPSP